LVNVQHNAQTGTDLHENKGVAAAANNTVATASSGTTVWRLLDNTNLGPLANPFGSNYIHLQDQKTSGTDGGTFSGGAWRTRTLNTKVTDDVGISLASNQFTLPVGTYFIYATAPGGVVGGHVLKLRNFTDSSDILFGTTEYSDPGTGQNYSRSIVSGRFTLSGTKTLEMDHRCTNSRNTDGFGKAANLGTETYTDVHIWKIG